MLKLRLHMQIYTYTRIRHPGILSIHSQMQTLNIHTCSEEKRFKPGQCIFERFQLTSRVMPRDVRIHLFYALIVGFCESLPLFLMASANVSSHTPRRPHSPLFCFSFRFLGEFANIFDGFS